MLKRSNRRQTLYFGEPLWAIKNKITRVEQPDPRVVSVYFGDGSSEKAVCSEEDTFDLDMALIICIAKHEMGRKEFYSRIREAKRVIKRQVDEAVAAREAKELEKL